MKQKKLMLLGGIRYLLPVIKVAHEKGYYVITCDYLPDNIAHKYSDEYVNVSIVDKEAVLAVAKEKKIDGIMSFGVDPGVVSASYVQNQLHLPTFGPYESVVILQNKDKFRAFLRDNGFNVPKSKGYSAKEDALADAANFDYPIIVKPTDSAGSKGVMRVDNVEQLSVAVDNAFEQSIKGNIIIEEFIEKKGCSSDCDAFCQKGKLKFISFNSQYFDEDAENPYIPAAFSWPSTFTQEQEQYFTSEIQRLLTLLQMETSVYNIETRIGQNDKPYIMEVTPRGGGNRLSEMIRYATGVDLIMACTCAAVGDEIPLISQKPYIGNWVEIILHSEKDGLFKELKIRDDLTSSIIEKDLWVKKGDKVSTFRGANDSIGTLVMNASSEQGQSEMLLSIPQWLSIETC